MANVTRQSSHRLRQRHGHTRIVRALVWHTTHCGPPTLPSAHACASDDDNGGGEDGEDEDGRCVEERE